MRCSALQRCGQSRSHQTGGRRRRRRNRPPTRPRRQQFALGSAAAGHTPTTEAVAQTATATAVKRMTIAEKKAALADAALRMAGELFAATVERKVMAAGAMREVEIVDIVRVDLRRPALQPRQEADHGQPWPRVVAVYVRPRVAARPFRALFGVDCQRVVPLTQAKRDESRGGAGGNRTPVHQPVDEPATTVPDFEAIAASPAGRLVTPRTRPSPTPGLSLGSAVFPAVSGLSHRHPPLLLPGCGGPAPCGIAAHDDSSPT